MVRASRGSTGQGVLREHSVKALLEKSVPGFADVESSPGPYGRVDPSMTQAAAQHLQRLSQSLMSEEAKNHIALRLAASSPRSAVLLCRVLACLLETGGKVESDQFWRSFMPVLAENLRDFCPGGEPSRLQFFCRRLACGDTAGALAGASEPSLWPHALIVAQLTAPEAFKRLLSQISGAILKPAASAGDAAVGGNAQLTDVERSDPLVQALLLLYDIVGRGAVPATLPDNVVGAWPAYVAIFCGVLRPSQYQSLAIAFLEKVGQKLIDHGDAFGAHVCHLLCGRTLEAVDSPTALVSLLGVDHRNPKNFGSLLEPLAAQLSEIYEYALRCGDQDALCPTLQPFKLVHAQILADLGLVDKANRYITILQAFVKAVPQSRLSEAFRASMRELNEQLSPSYSSMPATTSSEAPKSMVQNIGGFFSGLGRATGLTVGATPPPALGDDDEDEPPGASTSAPGMAPPPMSSPSMPSPSRPPAPPPVRAFQAKSAPPVPFAVEPPPVTTAPAPVTNPVAPPFGVSPPPGNPPFSPPSRTTAGLGSYPPPAAMPLLPAGSNPMAADSGIASGDGSPPPPQKTPSQNFNSAMDQDPLVSAAKGLASFGKGLFSKIKGGSSNEQQADARPKNDFYYDEVQKRWRQRGVEDVNIDDYDPMTGKKKLMTVTEPPPPPPPAMGGPPAAVGPPPMGGMSPPPMGSAPPPMGAPPMGAPPMGGAMAGAAIGGPVMAAASRRSGAGASGAGAGGTPLASPFGGGVRQSPF